MLYISIAFKNKPLNLWLPTTPRGLTKIYGNCLYLQLWRSEGKQTLKPKYHRDKQRNHQTNIYVDYSHGQSIIDARISVNLEYRYQRSPGP